MPYRLRIYNADDVLLSETEHELPQDAGEQLGRSNPFMQLDGHELEGMEPMEPIEQKSLLTFVDGDGNERPATPAEEAAMFPGPHLTI